MFKSKVYDAPRVKPSTTIKYTKSSEKWRKKSSSRQESLLWARWDFLTTTVKRMERGWWMSWWMIIVFKMRVQTGTPKQSQMMVSKDGNYKTTLIVIIITESYPRFLIINVVWHLDYFATLLRLLALALWQIQTSCSGLLSRRLFAFGLGSRFQVGEGVRGASLHLLDAVS